MNALFLFVVMTIQAQQSPYISPTEQKSCHECIAKGQDWCKLGGFQAESSNDDFRLTGYGSIQTSQKSICCPNWRNCAGNLKSKAFCSHLAGSTSMKYTFCDYNQNACMNSQSFLVPQYYGRQLSGSSPGQFYTNSSCFWTIGTPSEWTDNSIIKIKIKSLKNATCHLNSGGSMISSNINETQCSEGQEFEFKYWKMKQDFKLYLVSYATLNMPIIKEEPIIEEVPIAPVNITNSTENNNSTTASNNSTTTDKRRLEKYDQNVEIDIIGHIEFEYWAENDVKYDDLLTYILIAIFCMGGCVCLSINMIWKTSIEERIDSARAKIWKLRGKNKEYVNANAPGIVEMVSEVQAASYEGAHRDNSKKTKKQRIHDAELEIENAWCCTEGLLPIKKPGVAFCLCLLNILIPGFGTLCSICFVKDENQQIVPEHQAAKEEDSEEDKADEESEKFDTQGSASKQSSKVAPMNPASAPVVSLHVREQWSKKSAFLAAFGQFVTAPCGIGWLWSMSHGCVLFENSQIYGEIDKIRMERIEELEPLNENLATENSQKSKGSKNSKQSKQSSNKAEN